MNILYFVYPFICCWTFGLFLLWLLRIELLWIFMYTFLFECVFSSLGYICWSEIAGSCGNYIFNKYLLVFLLYFTLVIYHHKTPVLRYMTALSEMHPSRHLALRIVFVRFIATWLFGASQINCPMSGYTTQGLPWWLSGKESTCQCRRYVFDPWSRKIPHATE